MTKHLLAIAILLAAGAISATAQDTPRRVDRYRTLLTGKNILVRLKSGTDCYMTNSEQSPRLRLTGAQITIDGQAYDRAKIAGIRYADIPRVMLDQDSTAFAADYAAQHAVAAIHTDLKNGVWGSIILPFTLTAAQAKATFGHDVLIGRLAKAHDNGDGGSTDIDLVDLSDPSATALKANYPYFIRPSREPDVAAGSRMPMTYNGTRPSGPLWFASDISLAKSQHERATTVTSEDGSVSVRMNGTYKRLDATVLQGTVVRNKKAAPGTYMLDADGAMVQNADSAIVDAFHAYLTSLGTAQPTRFFINGAEQDITSVTSVTQSPRTDESGVYDISGRRVATLRPGQRVEAIGLPQGIYIRGGKKIAVQR